MDFFLTRVVWKVMRGKHPGSHFSLRQNPQFFDKFTCEEDFAERTNAKYKHPWHKSKDTVCHLEHGKKVRDMKDTKTQLNLIVDQDHGPINTNDSDYALRSEDQKTIIRASKNIWRLEGKDSQFLLRGTNLIQLLEEGDGNDFRRDLWMYFPFSFSMCPIIIPTLEVNAYGYSRTNNSQFLTRCVSWPKVTHHCKY